MIFNGYLTRAFYEHSLPESFREPLRKMYKKWLTLLELACTPVAKILFPHIPPLRISKMGPLRFISIGKSYFPLLQKHTLLRPTSQVLEIGCGTGQIALPLTSLLTKDGKYLGVDISLPQIGWCQKQISRRNPQFHFFSADLKSSCYNPKGKFSPENFLFPAEDRSYDIVLFRSVFTHLSFCHFSHYLHETNRVLKKGGQCFFTLFLLDPQALHLISQGKSTLSFPKPSDQGDSFLDEKIPELAVGYSLTNVQSAFSEAGFTEETFLPGWWCGRMGPVAHQDIFVIRKKKN